MPRRVLVIDDDAAFLRWLELQFTGRGFEVFPVSCAADAFRILSKEDVDLVVTDMRMPALDGYDVIYALKEQYPQMPIVLTTANPVNGRVKQALRYERVGLLQKPFTAPALVETVNDVAPDLSLAIDSRHAA